jgi:hypothetical protein
LVPSVGRHHRQGGRRLLPLDGTEQGRESRERIERENSWVKFKLFSKFQLKLEKL